MSVGILLAGSSLMAGTLLGFLFGIPRSLQQASAEPSLDIPNTSSNTKERASYGANTSLEQISDWLTKILVGVGLTQLTHLPTALAGLSDYVAQALGNIPGATLFGVTSVLYFSICGFLASYLWTRLHLGKEFHLADLLEIEHKVSDWEKQVEANLSAIERTLTQLDPTKEEPGEKDLAEAIASADELYASYISELADRVRRESRLSDKKRLGRTVPVFRALVSRKPSMENHFRLGAALLDKSPRDLEGCEENVSKAITLRGPWENVGYWGCEIVRAQCLILMDGNAERGERTKDESMREKIENDLRILKEIPKNWLDDETRKIISNWERLNVATHNTRQNGQDKQTRWPVAEQADGSPVGGALPWMADWGEESDPEIRV